MVLARDFSDNDIYLLEVVSNRIVINDRYDGIIVLDSGLNTVGEYPLMDDIVIEDSFIREGEMLLHCLENRSFVHVDIEKGTHRVIPLVPELYETAYLATYEWNGSRVLLLADDGKVGITVDVSTGEVAVTRDAQNDKAFSSVRRSWNIYRDPKVCKICPDSRFVLVEADNGIDVIHYDDAMRLKLTESRIPFHDLEISGTFLAQVSENGILLSDGTGSLTLLPEPDGYYFCWGRFLPVGGGTAFFTLASNNANSKECRISRHMLIPGMFTADGCGA
jgi:hypothetical protein